MKNLYLLIVLCLFSVGYGQNSADRDPSFNQFNLPLNNYFVDKEVNKSVVFPDGKIMILETQESKLYRLNGNLLDTSFNIGLGFSGGSILDFVIQTDGKILVVGTFTTFNGLSTGRIVRLNNDGSRDTSFNVGGAGFSQNATNVLLQPDGKIIVSGATTYNGVATNNIVRLNPDGSRDNSFVPNANVTSVGKIFLQADGKIIFTKILAVNQIQLIRINNDGSADAGFTPCTSNNVINMLKWQNDGKIIVGGQFTNFNSLTVNRLTRLNADGTVDNTFVTGTGIGMGTTSADGTVKDIAIQSDGKIIVCGDFVGYNNNPCTHIARINTDGSFDTTFTGSGGFEIFSVNNVSLLAGGKILATGAFNKYNNEAVNRITILNTDGSRDTSFNNICAGFDLADRVVSGNISSVALQSDGKILVAGRFNAYNGIRKSGLVRLNVNGTLDNTLTFGGLSGVQESFNDASISSMAVQVDGKILVAGDFIRFNDISVKRLIRLNGDGTQDASFVVGTGFNYFVSKIILLPNAKILVAGSFTSYKGISCASIVRLNSNGTLDATFSGVSAVGNVAINDMVLQSDGKIVVSGNFNSSVKGIVRLEADGTKDLSFVIDTLLVTCNGKLIIQQDNKILTRAQTNNGIANLVRLNGNGSLDNTFNFELGSLQMSPSLSGIQIDGKLFATGYYYSNSNNKFLVRLNSNGSVDSTFNNSLNNGFEASTNSPGSIIEQPDGKLLLYGSFKSYLGLPGRGLVRLLGEDYNFVQGQNKFDSNNNGCDVNDVVFSNLQFLVSSGANTINYIANTTGNYSIPLANGTHTITPVFENSSYFNASPPNITVGFPVQSTPLAQNFCITPNGVHPDLEVVLLPIGIARPGFDAVYKLVYKNKGNQLQSGTVSLTFNDAVMDFVSATPIASTQATNSRTWNFLNLKPFETKEIIITVNLNSPTETPALNAGNVLNYTTAITSAQTDETPNDNTFALNQTVVNSYDPNDKTCLQGLIVGTNKIGNYVHYVIRFENTGTYAAQNITVKDLIDLNKFDINSLMPLNGSHLFTTKISEGNKVEFKFENINLPFAAGTNTGYVAFKIKTKTTLVAGDTFGGLANIYFDYNYPITTNTYTTTIQALSVQDFAFENYFSLYPNPVSDVLNISSRESIEISSIHIYNVMGQLMMVIPNAKHTAAIDVSHLSTGNYFVKINSDKGTSNTKFIKR